MSFSQIQCALIRGYITAEAAHAAAIAKGSQDAEDVVLGAAAVGFWTQILEETTKGAVQLTAPVLATLEETKRKWDDATATDDLPAIVWGVISAPPPLVPLQ